MNNKYDYDAIIIGSGIGGLYCANLLTDFNQRVLVVEQHSRPGGYCSSFKRKGFVFDAAAHVISSLGARHNILDKITSNWKLDVKFLPLKDLDVLKFPDETFVVNSDMNHFITDLSQKYGEDETALKSLAKEIKRLIRHFFRGDPKDPFLREYRGLVFQDFVDQHITSPKVRAILSSLYYFVGIEPNRCSVFAMGALLTSYLIDGTFYVEGGVQNLADKLAQRFSACGGHIQFRRRITAVGIKDGCVSGIRTDSGDFISSPTVIANCDLQKLLPPAFPLNKVYRTIFGEDLKKIPEKSISAYAYYIGAKIADETADRLRGAYFNGTDMNAPDNLRLHVAVPSLYDPSIAPEGHHVVIASMAAPDPGKTGDSDPGRLRNLFQQRILDEFESIAPGFSQSIVHIESAAPGTFERYTLNPDGVLYGWEKTPENVFIDVETRVPGLYQVGHFVYPCCGISAVAYSGLIATKRIITKKYGSKFKFSMNKSQVQNHGPQAPPITGQPAAKQAQPIPT